MIVPSVVVVFAWFSLSLSFRLREFHQLEQQSISKTNWTPSWTDTCHLYEVCKCIGDSEEKNARCEENTCSYSSKYPTWMGCNQQPKCANMSGNWEDCEWANFQKQGDFPDTGSFMDVPKKSNISWTGITGVQVYTDIDDTIVCSGGDKKLGISFEVKGVDTECKGTDKHGFYPLVAEFQFALAKGPQNSFIPLKVIPVSARPSEVANHGFGIKEDSWENEKFQHVQSDWGFNVTRALYGDLIGGGADQLATWTYDTDLTRFDKMAIKKYRGWKAIQKDNNTLSIFVGDNGQGDAVAAQMMLKASESMDPGSGEMVACFIHDVVKKCSDQACRDKWAEYGIYMFSDYEDAFAIARKNGLIPEVAACKHWKMYEVCE